MAEKKEKVELNKNTSEKNNLELIKRIVFGILNVIPVIVGVWTVYHTTTAWEEDRYSKRAYIAISRDKESDQIKVIDANRSDGKIRVRINWQINNLGKNPAKDLNLKFLYMKKKTSEIGDFGSQYIANEFPPDFIMDPDINVLFPDNLDPIIIVIVADYSDPILNRSFQQFFYYSWTGIHDGKPYPLFQMPTKEEEDKFLEIYKET